VDLIIPPFQSCHDIDSSLEDKMMKELLISFRSESDGDLHTLPSGGRQGINPERCIPQTSQRSSLPPIVQEIKATLCPSKSDSSTKEFPLLLLQRGES